MVGRLLLAGLLLASSEAFRCPVHPRRRPPLTRQSLSSVAWASHLLTPPPPNVSVSIVAADGADGGDDSAASLRLDEFDAAILFVPRALATTNETTLAARWGGDRLFPHSEACGRRLLQRLRPRDAGDDGDAPPTAPARSTETTFEGHFFATELPNARGTRACFVADDAAASTFEVRRRRVCRELARLLSLRGDVIASAVVVVVRVPRANGPTPPRVCR